MLRRTASTVATSSLLLSGLLAGVLLPGPVAAERYPDYGQADVRDQKLRKGCHTYRVRYVVRPPTEEWSAIIQLSSPRGRKIGTVFLDADAPDPLRGARPFEICRVTVTPGRFTTQMEVIWEDGRDRLSAKTAPTTFRLTKKKPR